MDTQDKDIIIAILTSQRNSLMDQLTALQLNLEKMKLTAQDKVPPNDDKHVE